MVKENTKVKKTSSCEENDYGEENKMCLTLIVTANEKDKPTYFAQGGLFPPPYFHQWNMDHRNKVFLTSTNNEDKYQYTHLLIGILYRTI